MTVNWCQPSAAIAVAVVLALGVGARRASAQSAEAEALFNDGIQLMADGKLPEACDAFAASNLVEPRAGTLIRLGECREQTQQVASAWSAYKDALARAKDPKKRDLAAARAAALEPRLSFLTVSVSDESRVDGLELTRNGKAFDAVLWNRALPVDGGDYVIVGHAPGHEDWQTTAHVPGEDGKVSVEVPKFKELAKLAALTPARPGASTVVRASVTAPRRFTMRRRVAIGAAGVAVIGVVVGAIAGEAAKGKQHDAFALCPDPTAPCAQASQADALIRSGQHRALAANLAFGVAATAAISVGLLWFTGAPDADHPRRLGVAPAVAPGQAGVVVVGTF